MAYRIFVSHVWRAHHDYYWGLIRLLDRAKRFTFVDLSIPKIRPFDGDYGTVRDEVLRVLSTADVVLTINTPVITNSPAVQDELREAERLGIPIIAVRVPKRHGRTRRSKLPVIDRAHKAHWTTKSIVGTIGNAIREKRTAALQSSEPATDLGYEAISAAATATPLSPDALIKLRGDDETGAAESGTTASAPLTSTPSDTQEERPREVLFRSKENPAPKLPWYRRLWSAIGLRG
jgi:hypothetical protein